MIVLHYRRVVLSGFMLFAFFIILDWLISPNRVPRIDSAQNEFIREHLKQRGQIKRERISFNDLEQEEFIPVNHKLFDWFPIVLGQRQSTDIPQINAMQKTLSTLNTNMTSQDDPRLIEVIGKFWLRPLSQELYNLQDPTLKDFSKGQSAIVDGLLHRKEKGFFVECGALDGETRSNTLFFERERQWSGLLIEAGPLNYRKLVKKNRQAYSTPACLGVHPYPTKMYFHRGKNRGRLIDGKEALEWVRQQAMSVWLMEVQCFPLFSLLTAMNRTNIDYFSLDVEGVELEVLQTIPWDRVNIEVLTVEFAHDIGGKEAINRFMERRGYKAVNEVVRLDGLANDLVFRRLSADELALQDN